MSALTQNTDQGALLDAAGKAAKFTGKSKSKIDLLAPFGFDTHRVIILGCGTKDENKPTDWMNLGGVACAMVSSEETVSIQMECDGGMRGGFCPWLCTSRLQV
ncbi:MAG: M17 family peptidase N-terminal domain-containing protein [Ahrensia sp.]|nr:M17 family peptidase N-terminal domain-containing protein [Ahrensia sp.]